MPTKQNETSTARKANVYMCECNHFFTHFCSGEIKLYRVCMSFCRYAVIFCIDNREFIVVSPMHIVELL